MKSIKRFFLALGVLSLLFVSCPSSPNDPGTETGGTALEYFVSNNLTAGWNLGNTLDAHRNGVGGEIEWDNPAINQALLNGVKAQGFNLIRVPVTWMGHIGDAPNYTIAPARLSRVAEVVNMANTAGLKVIINLHHDGATASETNEAGWLSVRKAVASASDKAAITAKFTRVWEQIAAHFKDYGPWLMFESMNEIHDGGWCWSSAFRSNPKAQFDIINEWNQIFTDKVRASGGNNANRLLVIPSYCTVPEATYPGGKIKDQSAAIGNYFKLPTDSAEGALVVTFHYYRPDDFGLNATTANWGTASEKNEIDAAFKPFKAAYINNGIPVIIGECGAPITNTADTAKAHQSRIAYLGHVFGTAKKYGLVPVYWDNGVSTGSGEKFGLFNRNTGQPNSTDSKDLIDAMINAVK